MDSGSSASNLTGPDATLAQIERLIADIADLATLDVTVHDFHAKLLDRAIVGLAAVGGAVWTCYGGTRVRLDVESLVDPSRATAIRESQAVRKSRAEQAAGADRAVQIPPDGHGGTPLPGGNPTGCLLILCPITVAGETKAVIEILQRPDSPPEARDGFLNFLDELCHHAAEFHLRRELHQFRERTVLWARFEAFSHRVHSKVDLRETAFTIVNESRSVIGCERVSLAEVRGKHCRILAVSGVDTLNSRANSIRCLNALVAAAVATNEPFWYAGQAGEIAPQVEAPLQAYLDESPARLLAIVPLYAGVDDTNQERDAMLGALVVERFDGACDDEMQRRIGAVCGHAALALNNALDYRNLPTLPIVGPLIAARRRHRAGWKPRWLIGAAVVLLVLAALVLIPADFRVESTGELRPSSRFHVFAPADGTVRINQLPVSKRSQVGRNEIVAVLKSAPLEMQHNQIWGELQTVEKQLDAVRNERFGRESPDGTRKSRSSELTARTQELEQQRESLRERLKLLEARKRELTVRSPVSGEVLTWDVVRRLEGRPVRQGQILMSVAKLDGSWEVLLRVPERDIGYVLDAQRRLRSDLAVTFETANQPGTVHRARIRRVSTATQIGSDGRSIVFVTLGVDDSSGIPLRPGTTVSARIHCGTRSIGYVWFHDVIDAARSWLRS